MRTLIIAMPDGTIWPNPNVDADDLPEPQRTHYLNAVLEAYVHLTCHPIGVEATIRKLRMVRREVRKRCAARASG